MLIRHVGRNDNEDLEQARGADANFDELASEFPPLSSKYRSQVKSIPSEVHNAAIITCARTSLSISESCEFH